MHPASTAFDAIIIHAAMNTFVNLWARGNSCDIILSQLHFWRCRNDGGDSDNSVTVTISPLKRQKL
eukprot:15355440-Ditylum_brightwellii.AAC.1